MVMVKYLKFKILFNKPCKTVVSCKASFKILFKDLSMCYFKGRIEVWASLLRIFSYLVACRKECKYICIFFMFCNAVIGYVAIIPDVFMVGKYVKNDGQAVTLPFYVNEYLQSSNLNHS